MDDECYLGDALVAALKAKREQDKTWAFHPTEAEGELVGCFTPKQKQDVHSAVNKQEWVNKSNLREESLKAVNLLLDVARIEQFTGIGQKCLDQAKGLQDAVSLLPCELLRSHRQLESAKLVIAAIIDCGMEFDDFVKKYGFGPQVAWKMAKTFLETGRFFCEKCGSPVGFGTALCGDCGLNQLTT